MMEAVKFQKMSVQIVKLVVNTMVGLLAMMAVVLLTQFYVHRKTHVLNLFQNVVQTEVVLKKTHNVKLINVQMILLSNALIGYVLQHLVLVNLNFHLKILDNVKV